MVACALWEGGLSLRLCGVWGEETKRKYKLRLYADFPLTHL